MTLSLAESAIYSAQDSVVHAIQRAIFSGELKLGQRILEEELAARLGISRATLREALRRLEQVGLVRIKPRRGTFVTKLSLQEIEHNCRLRSLLEGLAARYASEHLTAEHRQELGRLVEGMRAAALENGDRDSFLHLDLQFHHCVWRISGDQVLEYLLKFLSTPYFAFIASISTYVFSDLDKVLRSHEQYLAALDGTPDEVQARVQQIHDLLGQEILVDIRRKQAELPHQLFGVDEGDSQ